MSDTLSASQHAAKNYGGSASDSSLSAGELRRRYNVKDNKQNWAATSAPGVQVGDDGGSMMVVGLVAVMLVIAIVAFYFEVEKLEDMFPILNPWCGACWPLKVQTVVLVEAQVLSGTSRTGILLAAIHPFRW